MYLTVSNPIEIPDEYKNIGSKLVNVNVNGNDIKIVRTWALSKYREQKFQLLPHLFMIRIPVCSNNIMGVVRFLFH